MKIAACQMHILWEQKEENIRRAERFVGEAAKDGAELILFPEMSFTGFSMNIDCTADKEQETITCMKGLAQKYGVDIGFGWVRKCGNKGENHYSVVDKFGNFCADYIKIHPFGCSEEGEYFNKGEKIVEFSLNGRTITPFICYDLRFPEIFQGASKRSDIILVAANWPESRREHWRCLLRARAIENQCYIIGINCVGQVGDLMYSGDSVMIAPDGVILEELSYQEGLLIKEIPDDVEQYRTDFPMRLDRRTEFYKSIL